MRWTGFNVVLLSATFLAVPGRPALAQQATTAPAAAASRTAAVASSTAPATTTSTAPAAPTTQGIESLRLDQIVQMVQNRARQVQEDKQLDEATRAKAVDLYGQVLKELQSAETWSRRAADADKAIAEAPAQLEAFKQRVKKGVETQVAREATDRPLPQLQAELDQAVRRLAESRRQLADLENRQKVRSQRRTEIKQRQEEIARELIASPQPTEPQAPPVVVQAYNSLQRARRAARIREQEANEKDLAKYDATSELLTLQRDGLTRQIGLDEKLVTSWQDAVNKRRLKDAAEAARAAQEDARAQAGSLTVVRDMADFNLNLANRRQELSVRIEKATQRYNQIQKQLDTTGEGFREAQVKVGAAGVSGAVGLMLRQERAGLPKLSLLHQELRSLQENRAEAEVAQIDYRRQHDRLLADAEGLVAADVARLDRQQLSPKQRDEAERSLREGYATRREYLESLISDYDTYLSKLIELQGVTEALIKETEAYEAFINEHILWLRSDDELRLGQSLTDAREAVSWMTHTAEQGELPRAAARDFLSNPLRVSVALIGCVVIIAARRRFRIRLEQEGEKASQRLNTTFAPTAAALLWTVLLAVSWPLMFWVLAWRFDVLTASVQVSELSKAVSSGLARVGFVLLMMEGIRELCRPQGLAESHLAWPKASLALLRRHLLWLMLMTLPIGFTITVMDQWQTAVDWTDSLSRLVFLAGLAAVTLFTAIVLRPSTGVFREHLGRHRGGFLDRFRYFWYLGALGVPLLLGGLAFYGYYYTSLQLVRRTYASVWFVLAMVVIRGLILRWIVLTHRKLAIAQARKRLAERHTEALRAEESPGAAKEESPQEPEPEPEPELDFAVLSDQTRQLFGVALALALVLGLWLIWEDILPALGYLQSIMVYPKADVTLADLALAIATLVMIHVANRNVPGFLEIVVLPHLPLKSGERYAVTAICRYVIIAVGIMAACGFLGITWSKVQWLLAAVTVGLGFGLQEIFANFVSGLILLFERPIRVGDTVTIGQVNGTISRIHIRATTVTTWDRKELIIPNKEFVTGQVVNWTLSDSVLRIVIPIGVAYGSDTALVERILQRIADQHELVLQDPAPQVFFVGFGASSLDFEMRAFISGVESFASVRHELLSTIDAEFRKARIEIAFPQQDIHIRTVQDAFPIIDQREDRPGQPTV
jgi:potassium-dependent mechanosensitive channel